MDFNKTLKSKLTLKKLYNHNFYLFIYFVKKLALLCCWRNFAGMVFGPLAPSWQINTKFFWRIPFIPMKHVCPDWSDPVQDSLNGLMSVKMTMSIVWYGLCVYRHRCQNTNWGNFFWKNVSFQWAEESVPRCAEAVLAAHGSLTPYYNTLCLFSFCFN